MQLGREKTPVFERQVQQFLGGQRRDQVRLETGDDQKEFVGVKLKFVHQEKFIRQVAPVRVVELFREALQRFKWKQKPAERDERRRETAQAERELQVLQFDAFDEQEIIRVRKRSNEAASPEAVHIAVQLRMLPVRQVKKYINE